MSQQQQSEWPAPEAAPAYKPSRSLFLSVRGRTLHCREWGTAGNPQLFLLHGWGDISATFQFLVDAFTRDWHVIAPDWRGFGLSRERTVATDTYWFADYFADLEQILLHYSPKQPATLIGHSMGGNVACVYAGLRPQRVAALVSLDAFGLPPRKAEDAPARLTKWLDQLAAPRQFRSYPDRAALAQRLQRDNPRLSAPRAAFLAQQLGEDDGAGGVRVAIDVAHQHVNPVPYRRDEAEACWRQITAPVLWVSQASSEWRRSLGVDDALYQQGLACFARLREVALPDSGHNLHHDQPERLAALIEEFLAEVAHDAATHVS